MRRLRTRNGLRAGKFDLLSIETLIESPPLHQLGVKPLFDNLAVIQYQNPIGAAKGG